MDYKIIPFKDDRFAITNMAGTIIDDAQHYGYKTVHNAHKAASWRFKGGEERCKADDKFAKSWIKDINALRNIDVESLFEQYCFYDLKESLDDHSSFKNIFDALAMDTRETIPHAVKMFLKR